MHESVVITHLYIHTECFISPVPVSVLRGVADSTTWSSPSSSLKKSHLRSATKLIRTVTTLGHCHEYSLPDKNRYYYWSLPIVWLPMLINSVTLMIRTDTTPEENSSQDLHPWEIISIEYRLSLSMLLPEPTFAVDIKAPLRSAACVLSGNYNTDDNFQPRAS